MDETEILHTVYSLRVALSCLYASMPAAQRAKATAYMSQHSLEIEAARDQGTAGAAQLLTVMNAQFDAIHKAARIEMQYMKPQPLAKRPRVAKTSMK
jgi:hypothetical protein